MKTIKAEKLAKVKYEYYLKIYSKDSNQSIIDITDSDNRINKIIKEDNPILSAKTQQITPILKLLVTCTSKERQELHENKDKLIADFALGTIHSVTKDNKNDNDADFNIVLNKKFEVILNDAEPSIITQDDNQNVTGDEINNTSVSTATMHTTYDVEMLFLLISERNRLKKQINFNYSDESGTNNNSTVANAIACVLSMAEFPENSVILQKPDRDIPFNQIMVPTGSVSKVLHGIQKDYGIYKSGLFLYQDFDKFYILPSVPGSDGFASEDGKPNKIFIYQMGSDMPAYGEGMYLDEEEDRYVITSIRNSQIIDNSAKIKEGIGSNIHIVPAARDTSSIEFKNGEWLSSQQYESHDSNVDGISDSRTKEIYNSLKNEYLAMSMRSKTMLLSTMIIVKVKHTDFSIFTFNKDYHLVFYDAEKNDAKFTGKFRLLYSRHTFSKSQISKLSCNSVFIFGLLDVCEGFMTAISNTTHPSKTVEKKRTSTKVDPRPSKPWKPIKLQGAEQAMNDDLKNAEALSKQPLPNAVKFKFNNSAKIKYENQTTLMYEGWRSCFPTSMINASQSSKIIIPKSRLINKEYTRIPDIYNTFITGSEMMSKYHTNNNAACKEARWCLENGVALREVWSVEEYAFNEWIGKKVAKYIDGISFQDLMVYLFSGRSVATGGTFCGLRHIISIVGAWGEYSMINGKPKFSLYHTVFTIDDPYGNMLNNYKPIGVGGDNLDIPAYKLWSWLHDGSTKNTKRCMLFNNV